MDDMDAFSDKTRPINTLVVTNTYATTNNTINTNDISVNDSNKRIESDEIPPINSETETLPKKIDITDIIKDVPIPFVAPVETCDETDRIEYDNEKLVQVKIETNSENDTNIIQLRSSLPYKDDQWSPLNSNGKIVYDKEFLLALRNDPKSRKKPENLLDVIAREDRGRVGDINRYPIGGKSTDFTLKGSKYDGRSLSNQQKGILPKRNNQQGKSGGNTEGNSTSDVIASTIVLGDVKLNESENPWKPARFRSTIDMSDDDKETQELYKKVRSALNKLTPQKFATLLVQVRSLAIGTKERLQGVIDLVFEKAVDEPNFSVAYASMCSQLALMQVPSNVKKEGGEPTVNFRKLLITRCQLEFEKNSVDETARNAKLKEIEECTDPEKKKELQLLLEQEYRRIRRKSVGCIRFIGELFKQGMLTTNIMKKCLDQLLDNREQESLECLCELLLTIGKAINDKGVDLSQTFVVIGEIVDGKHGKIDWKVRCMLYDVIDLRNSKWIPRRQDLNPKTIDQIQKEAFEEQNVQKQEFLLGGSNTVISQSELIYEQIRIKLLHLLNNEKSPDGILRWIFMTVGRRAREKQFVRTLAAAVFENSIVKSKLKIENLKTYYSLLKRIIDGRFECELECLYALQALINKLEHPQGILLSMCCSLYNDHVISHNGFVKWGTSNSVAEQEGKSIALKQLTSFFIQLKEVDEGTLSTEDTVVIRSELTYEQIHIKLLDLLKNGNPLDDLFLWIYAHVGERAPEEQFVRTLATAVFENSIVKSQLKIENLKKYYSLLKCIIDGRFECELECLYALQALINKLEHPQGILLSMCSSLYDDGVISHDGFAKWETSDNVAEQEGKGIALKQLTSFFTQLREVDERRRSTEDTVVIPNELTYEQIHIKLLDLLKNEHSPDYILRWIYVNVGERAPEKQFVRTLAAAVFENSIVKSKLKIENLKKYYSLLIRIIDGQLDCELECLYALQALINKLEHPQGILLSMCCSLYNDHVISHDGFVKWGTSNSVPEQEGKSIALKQLTSFFIQLKEVDEGTLSTEDTVVIRSELTYEQIHIKLLDLLKNENPLDDLLLWIYAHVGERTPEKQFVRTLATAVFENSIVKSKLEIENLKKYYSLLKRIIDGRFECELECLYALQALINKLEHPQGILLSMCCSLYNDHVISHDGFVKWGTSNSVAEQKGKSIALKQLTSFFIQLKEVDEGTLSTEDTVVIRSELTYEQIHIKLLDLLKNEKSPDDIFIWIYYAHVGERAPEKQFVRTLATAVFENSIVKSKLKIENLKKYHSLLKRIIGGRFEYELECLYALQALINKLEHPQGILLSMCNSLYIRRVISPVSFVKWETSDDVAEQEGKGAALKQLTNFFAYLRRADPC